MNAQQSICRAATAAYRCLVHLQIDSLPVQPMELLKRCRSTRVMSLEQATETLGQTEAALVRQLDVADAWTYCAELADGRTRHIVVFRTDGNPARRRFSLAHELGHIVMQHHGRALWEEQEADVFASHLLCPQPLLELWAETGRPLDAADIAYTCYVSRACAEKVLTRSRAAVPADLEDEVRGLLSSVALEKGK